MLGLAGLSAAADFRLGVRAGRLVAWACRGATRRWSATCSARGWCSTSSSPSPQLGPIKETLDPRSFTIATFALCGFANFSSIGIQIGGIGALVARAAARSRAAGAARDAGRHARQLHDRHHRRLAALRRGISERLSTSAHRGGGVPARPRIRRRRGGRGAGLGPGRVCRDDGRAVRARVRATFRTGRPRPSSATPGRLSAACSSGRHVLALSGRVHFYEGHRLTTVTFPMRVLGPARRAARDPHQRRRRHQHEVHPGRADADRRSHQPDGQQPAGRCQRRALRSAVSGHERGLFDAPARARLAAAAAAAGVAIEHGVYIAVHGPSYETPAEIRAFRALGRRRGRACPPRRKPSSRVTWASRCSASRASPTWRRACCRSRCVHDEVVETALARARAVHRAAGGHH